ncbi:MAG: transporter substrate-binding domain-containing protein [Eggerthellaceae bacterium]|nr:transporter substrate-binding domain-containing protein [Eggerthellaceae bacterium]
MKKVKFAAAFVAAFALAAFVLVGCSSGGSSSASASASSASASSESASASSASASSAASGEFTLVVGFDAEYPPYGFVGDDGQYTGFDLDLAQAVCEANGWEFKAEPIDWDAKDALLNSGAINCIWNGFTMEGREGNYAFSDPYMLNEQVVVVKKDSGIADLAGLAGKAVMTQADSAALEVLSDEEGQKALADTFAKLETIGDYNNAFMQLDSGMVDAVACDLSIAQYQMSANPDKYVMIEEPLSSEHYAVGFAKDDTATAETVTASLKALYADGTVKTLCEKYAEYGLSFDNWVLV